MLADDWFCRARLPQWPPVGAWHTWLIVGGRGSGKTRAGAEWINAMARRSAQSGNPASGVIALVGETLADVRDVMIEGPSGILATARHDRPRFEVSRRRVLWESGMIGLMFSSEDPESLRGPQFGAAWCDEICKWHKDQETYDMLQFGLRLGESPRQVLTTTPKPTGLFLSICDDPLVVRTHMATRDNADHLAPGFVAAMDRRYGGTRLGRQELDGELVLDRDGALWGRDMLDRARCSNVPELTRIVVAVDPPVTGKATSDACGIVVAGRDAEGRAFVLADGTMRGAKSTVWAQAALALYHRYEADALIVETNQGGDLLTDLLNGLDETVPVKSVRARRSKQLRAEPVAALYEQGRVRHACALPELEDEMCAFTTNGFQGRGSPDRLDALVWAITNLLLTRRSDPRIRSFA